MDGSNFMRGARLLGFLALMWGLSWPITKIALSQIDPWTLRAVGLNLGGIGLLVVAHFQGYRPFVERDEVKYLLLVALFNVTFWSITAAYGLSQVASGRAIIIAYTMPIWSSVLSVVVLHEPFGLRRLLGLVLAVAGLAMLVTPAWKNLEGAPLGVALLIFASLSWAIGTVAYKAAPWRSPAIVLAGWQLILGAIPITIGMMAIGNPDCLDHAEPENCRGTGICHHRADVPVFLHVVQSSRASSRWDFNNRGNCSSDHRCLGRRSDFTGESRSCRRYCVDIDCFCTLGGAVQAPSSQ